MEKRGEEKGGEPEDANANKQNPGLEVRPARFGQNRFCHVLAAPPLIAEVIKREFQFLSLQSKERNT